MGSAIHHEIDLNFDVGVDVMAGAFGKLTAAVCGLWVVMAVPVYLLAGSAGLGWLAISAAVCLVPGWLVFWMAARYGVADSQVFAVIAGTMCRLGFVLSWVLAFQEWKGALPAVFLIPLGVFYAATLAIETRLTLGPPKKAVGSTVSVNESGQAVSASSGVAIKVDLPE